MRETKYVPTCDGNDAITDIGLCPAAVDTCPTPGDVNYWVFRRQYLEGAVPPPFSRVLDPVFVCLGPDDPALDPAVAIPALIEREFKRVVVLKGAALVSPRPDTLINIPTRFETSAPETYDIPLTLLGQSVVITARAQRWTWHVDAGVTVSTTAAGSKGRVEHAYARTGERQAYVVIEWSGTFRVGGGPERPILGTATTTGDPVVVAVKQARSELVDQSG